MIIKFSHVLGILSVDGQTMEASCHVRNDINGERELLKPSEVVYAMTGNRYDKKPYMPSKFPAGIWQVFAPQERTSPYLAPYFIPTNAKQLVHVWALDDDGGYAEQTEERVMDHGYGLHYSVSPTTLGCIRICNKNDLMLLVRTVEAAIDRKEYVTIEVI